MENKITATIGGIAVKVSLFSIKTDMNSYAWSGSLTITAEDYAKVKDKLNAGRGSEPLITVTINGFAFSIIAEEQSKTRQFANHSYNLGGRSITARLGADYALPQAGLLDQDNYASQIVNQQLNNLLINVKDFLIDDYYIPANQYAVSGKTPIAVINDIAEACGGFVETHPSQPLLSLKKRWKKPAWELATAEPDVIIPADVIRQLNDKKRINPRYNTATLTSSVESGIVYRQAESRDSESPVSDNPLYTDKKAIIPAGITILSDSGIHQDYTLTMNWAKKYNIPLAECGQIWQINDPEGAWRGVVTGVSVNVGVENNAPTVWQTVNIDRYIDK